MLLLLLCVVLLLLYKYNYLYCSLIKIFNIYCAKFRIAALGSLTGASLPASPALLYKIYR